jgi:hypothetical protein
MGARPVQEGALRGQCGAKLEGFVGGEAGMRLSVDGTTCALREIFHDKNRR